MLTRYREKNTETYYSAVTLQNLAHKVAASVIAFYQIIKKVLKLILRKLNPSDNVRL